MEFIDKSGRKRTGIEAKCLTCGLAFGTRVDQPQKYCSRQCRDEARTNREELVCDCCSKKFFRKKSGLKYSRSGFRFCSLECKNKSQRIGGITEIMPPHYGTSTADRDPRIYRRIFKSEWGADNLNCMRCGYSEFECGIDIHHLDGDSRNNEKSNLVSLCSPCHRALHFKHWNIDEIQLEAIFAKIEKDY